MDPARVPGTRVAVCGGGYTGQALARALRRLGKQVVVTDDRGAERMAPAALVLAELEVKFRPDGHDPELLAGADLVVISPGVSIKTPGVQAALAAGVPVWGEVELAARLTDARLVGITGTKGKTTTATLVSLMLDAPLANAEAYTARGVPLIDLVADNPRMELAVVEMSNFQLESAVDLKPWVAALLNLAEDHRDRQSREEYLAAKARIFARQDEHDRAVYCHDDALVRGIGEASRAAHLPFSLCEPVAGAYATADGVYGPRGPIAAWDEVSPAMRVQRPSLVASCAVALAADGDEARLRQVIAEFPGLPHRMEFVREWRRVTFINDSKATNPLATENAIRQSPAPVVLLAGGRTKGIDLSPLREPFGLLRGLVLYGEDADRLEAAARAAGVVSLRRAESLEAALEAAVDLARPGDWVILSPSGASFDMFANFAERGEAFRSLVRALGE